MVNIINLDNFEYKCLDCDATIYNSLYAVKECNFCGGNNIKTPFEKWNELHYIYHTHWSDHNQEWGPPVRATINNLNLPFAYFSAKNHENAISFVATLNPLTSTFKKGYFPDNFWLGSIPNEMLPKHKCILCKNVIPNQEIRNKSIFGHIHTKCSDDFLSVFN